VLAAETFLRSFYGSRLISHSVIRFKTPVNISEIKILSPSNYLTNSNGGIILGATEPNEFSVQFFCNNVYRQSRFENLGILEYSENTNTKLLCNNNVWADRLVICGRFLAITVVVSGTPENPDATSVQRRDRRINLPFPDAAGGTNEILTLPDDYFMHPSIQDILVELQSDSESAAEDSRESQESQESHDSQESQDSEGSEDSDDSEETEDSDASGDSQDSQDSHGSHESRVSHESRGSHKSNGSHDELRGAHESHESEDSS